MAFGSKEFTLQSGRKYPWFSPETNNDFGKLLSAGRKALSEHNQDRFIIEFYSSAFSQERDYSQLENMFRAVISDRWRTISDQEDLSLEELCSKLWSEAGIGIEISGLWFITYMSTFKQALKACPQAEVSIYGYFET